MAGDEEGLAGYWTFNEGQGNIAYDISPTQNHGTITGAIWTINTAPMASPTISFAPDPADGAVDVPRDAVLSWSPGSLAIMHDVYFGTVFEDISEATRANPLDVLVSEGQAATTYAPQNVLQFGQTYYWRVDEFDAAETHKGDIWFFTTPGAVGDPQPAYGATDVGMNATLSWMPADSAASHQLYIGTDKEAVRNADTGSPEYKGSRTLGAESYDPGLLDTDTPYYWRVDEINGQGNVAKGPVWVFTTGDFLLIDDFESYTDDDPNNEAIWQHWIDGFGIADNGSQVGNLLPPYAEQTIVHGGLQSMPLFYTNEGGVTNSEATLTLTSPRDWTLAGVSELSVWFRGASGNAADPLYVAISNSAGSPAMVAQDDPEAAMVRPWTQWRIPLQGFVDQGINLSNVDKIAIGLGSKGGAAVGGTGTMYIDDIRLYRP
ncbi:MAG: hypothetical protein JXM79_21025 [Sedimentisphaerales bacterium]|nr:hypothetical protein [Sedimentisphaerales bacterium]